MIVLFDVNGKSYKADLSKPYDLSITLKGNSENLRAWYVDFPKMEAVKLEDFEALVAAGSSVNFRNISFNPHGHGTHTESFGHITKEIYPVHKVFNNYFFLCQLISIKPDDENQDLVIKKSQIESKLYLDIEALAIRTLPNDLSKKSKNYSNTNPAYLHVEATKYIREWGVSHLMIDTPSVDREEDAGALLSHHEFWQIPENPRKEASITELIFAEDSIADGLYLMNLQVANFENDAAPSRPLLYPIVL